MRHVVRVGRPGVAVEFVVSAQRRASVEALQDGCRLAVLDRSTLACWLARPAGEWRVDDLVWSWRSTADRPGEGRVHLEVHGGSSSLTVEQVRALRRFLARRPLGTAIGTPA